MSRSAPDMATKERSLKKPHCAMCQSPDTMTNGGWLICKKCGFRRRMAK